VSEYVLELIDIHKKFPGVYALKGVNLKVKAGTVHGVMGENGAGKSTLMKIAIGLYQPDSGVIKLKGKEIHFSTIHEALQSGISMIHQELSPLPFMTVAQKIFLGREIRNKWGLIDHKAINEESAKILKELDINISPTEIMGNLTVAHMQLVEIAEAVSRNADIVIMDEPTSALTDKEVHQLFKIIRNLKAKGVAIIYITHKMDEIFEITDEVSVYRDGEFIGNKKSSELDKPTLIKMMVGRSVDQFFQKEKAEIGKTILEVKNLSRKGKFRNIDFVLRKGEILGFAGLVGAGRSELMETIFGVYPKSSGTVLINGKEVEINSPFDAIKNGLAFLTEDRRRSGLYLTLSVRDNISIACFREHKKGIFIDFKEIEEICNNNLNALRIKTPNLDQPVMFLSGGNQQKTLVSRWLSISPDILIMDEPTRGIDVGAKAEIYKLMSELAKQGKAIILVSSEMPEILAMSDRIIVMHEGDKIGELTRDEATQEKILHMATGESLETFIDAAHAK